MPDDDVQIIRSAGTERSITGPTSVTPRSGLVEVNRLDGIRG